MKSYRILKYADLKDHLSMDERESPDLGDEHHRLCNRREDRVFSVYRPQPFLHVARSFMGLSLICLTYGLSIATKGLQHFYYLFLAKLKQKVSLTSKPYTVPLSELLAELHGVCTFFRVQFI